MLQVAAPRPAAPVSAVGPVGTLARVRTSLVVSLVLALLAGADGCRAQQDGPQYGIRMGHPPTGSSIRRYAVSPSSIPVNQTYGELSATDRAKLHQWWESIPDGDEPPFPREGLKPMFDAMRQAQQKLLVTGELLLVATVEADGQVSQVQAVGSPSPEMTRFSAALLTLTRFKPALCAGAACRMDFPLRYRFRVE